MKKYKAGKTSLISIPELSKKFDLPKLLFKDESKNTFGTWKDRRSEIIIAKAIKQKIEKFAVITSGNAGYSLAMSAKGTKIKVVSIIDKDTFPSIKKQLVQCCYQVIESDLSKKLSPKDILRMVRENKKEKILDVSNGYHVGYEAIVSEIKKEKPDYIICPVGSGEAFFGIQNGIKKYKLKTKLIGVAPKSANSFADKLPAVWTPYHSKINYLKMKEEDVRKAYLIMKKYLSCEPSGSIGLAALFKLKLNKNKKIIVINSGKGIR